MKNPEKKAMFVSSKDLIMHPRMTKVVFEESQALRNIGQLLAKIFTNILFSP